MYILMFLNTNKLTESKRDVKPPAGVQGEHSGRHSCRIQQHTTGCTHRVRPATRCRSVCLNRFRPHKMASEEVQKQTKEENCPKW